MAFLAIFQPDPKAEARIQDALGVDHEVVLARSWASLELLLGGESLDGCVVDADFPGREEAVAEIRRIRQAHPGLAIVAYADVGESDLELFRFGRIGVDGIVVSGPAAPHAGIRHAADRALAASRAGRVRAALEGRYGPFAADAVAWAVEHASEKPCVATFAAAMGRSPRALGQALRAERLPTANRLLVWGRILLAGAYLARDSKTVEDTAYVLGYSSANALGRAMKRETGHTPSDVAGRGGMALVQSAIFPRVSTLRRRRTDAWKAMAILLLVLVAAPVGALGGGHHTPRETIDTTANINSLSGYLVGDDGREVDFSILSNGSGLPSARVREAFDDVAHALQGRRP